MFIIENFDPEAKQPDLVKDWYYVFDDSGGKRCYTMHLRAFTKLRMYSQLDQSVSVFRETWLADVDFIMMCIFLMPVYFWLYFQPYC